MTGGSSLTKKVIAAAIWLIAAASVTSGRDWRGIVLLKSTRADVERTFGRAQRSSKSLAYYNLKNEIVVFHFQSGGCDIFGYGWNVPLGTVVGIGVIPKGTHQPEEYELASDAKVDDNGAGFVSYSDYPAGLKVETFSNRVTLLDYYPQAAQENLRCPRIQECCVDFRHRFDEYTGLSFSDEKARLDNFAIYMNEYLGRGTIEALGPSESERQKQMERARRAKTYLVKERGLEAQRIFTIDGGFNEEPMIRLSFYSIGGVPSLIFVYRQEDPVKPGVR